MFSSTVILVYIVRCCCRCTYPRSVLGAGIVGTLGAGAAESRERSLQLDGLQAVYIVLFLYTIPTVYIISYPPIYTPNPCTYTYRTYTYYTNTYRADAESLQRARPQSSHKTLHTRPGPNEPA